MTNNAPFYVSINGCPPHPFYGGVVSVKAKPCTGVEK